jgi:hypothetical protein
VIFGPEHHTQIQADLTALISPERRRGVRMVIYTSPNIAAAYSYWMGALIKWDRDLLDGEYRLETYPGDAMTAVTSTKTIKLRRRPNDTVIGVPKEVAQKLELSGIDEFTIEVTEHGLLYRPVTETEDPGWLRA